MSPLAAAATAATTTTTIVASTSTFITAAALDGDGEDGAPMAIRCAERGSWERCRSARDKFPRGSERSQGEREEVQRGGGNGDARERGEDNRKSRRKRTHSR